MVKIQRPQQVRLDNLSSLPLDLLVQITKYLDPADIIRSQRVGTYSVRFAAVLESNCSMEMVPTPRSRSDGTRFSQIVQLSRLRCARRLISWV